MAMVRKQLYIEEGQDRAIKRRAKTLGVSEAEVVRAALDAALAAEVTPVQTPSLDKEDPLELVLALAAEDVRQGHRLPAERYRREELYAERDEHLLGRSTPRRAAVGAKRK